MAYLQLLKKKEFLTPNPSEIKLRRGGRDRVLFNHGKQKTKLSHELTRFNETLFFYNQC